ncbi:MAG: 30S ribosomal protein S19e [Nanoarchaeota archaeon]|nr:30S ribosomal protein S19e [Nanoarchaeota archaeon]
MKDIYNVPQNELIEKTALELKKIPSIKPPAWAEFVKTGTHKERPPSRDDWWYVRAAAILRTTHKLGPIGVSKLRAKYGGKKNRGVKPEKFYSGSGKIIRTILQQLEEAELVKKAEKGVHKGRIIAPKGISILDKTAAQISGKKPQAAQKAKPSELKKEIKKPEVIEKKPKDIKEKPKEEKPIAQKTEKVEKKPEVKKQDIKTEKSQEIKKSAEEKKEKVPTAAELAKKTKK